MIVTCRECQTQFQLDDAKVPATGIRVRCSRCKCAFFVESPHSPDPDHGERLAREALGAAGRAPVADSVRDTSASDEESDWQFNEDVDSVAGGNDSVGDLAAARSAVDDLLGSSATDSVDPVTGESEAADDSESPFGSFADGDELNTPDPAFSAESALDSEAEQDPNAITLDRGNSGPFSADRSSDSDFDLDGTFVAEHPDPAAAESPLASSEAFGEASEDLGSPAGWDFFENDDAPASAGAGSRSGSESEAAFGIDDLPAFAVEDDTSESRFETSRGDVWFSRARGLLGWALVTALCVYAGATLFVPELLAAAPGPAVMRVAGFEVVQLEGRWVENAAAGPIYVVSGALHTAGGSRPDPGTVLRVRLIDAQGAEVLSEPAVVGPPIPTRRLREWNLRDLRSGQQRAAGAILHEALERRKRRPFMAVLAKVPERAVAFDLEVSSATAAAPAAVTSDAIGSEPDARDLGSSAGAGLPAAEATLPAATR